MTEVCAARLVTSHLWVSIRADVMAAAGGYGGDPAPEGQPLWVLELSIRRIISPAGDGHAAKSP